MNIFERLDDWRREIKFAYQKITRGYCDRDVWSMDIFFFETFSKMLRQLKRDTHSYPGFNGMTMRKWKGILTKMINGFDAGVQIGNMDFIGENDTPKQIQIKLRKLEKKQNKAMKLFCKWINALWD